MLYDSQTGVKGARIAFFQGDGTTPAILGTDYIIGNNFIAEESYYESPPANQTRIFKCGGIFQALKIIVVKPQIK
jgi:hypothetical protein